MINFCVVLDITKNFAIFYSGSWVLLQHVFSGEICDSYKEFSWEEFNRWCYFFFAALRDVFAHFIFLFIFCNIVLNISLTEFGLLTFGAMYLEDRESSSFYVQVVPENEKYSPGILVGST